MNLGSDSAGSPAGSSAAASQATPDGTRRAPAPPAHVANRVVRFVLAAWIVGTWGLFFASAWLAGRAGAAGWLGPEWRQAAAGGCLVAVLFFLVDSFRRQYTCGDRPLAIALAVSGLGLGITTLIYYLLWGWAPARRADRYGTAFCAACQQSTRESPPPACGMVNFLGSWLLGDRDQCPECYSTLKTHWVFLLVPVFPLGTYRVVAQDARHYQARRCQLDWPTVVSIYATLVLAAIGLWFLFR